MTVRVLSYNIRHGGVGREQPLRAVLKACNADVVLLQEAVQPFVVQRLADECGYEHRGSIKGHSVAYLSRLPLSHHAWHAVRFARRRYLEVVLADTGLRLFGVHLSAVHSNVTEQRRVWELRALLAGIAQHAHGPHAVLGDFNTLAPGEELELRRLPLRLRAITWLTGRKIRWAAIRMMLQRGYVDVWRSVNEGNGSTFPTWDPHIRLDYAFVPEALAGRVSQCMVMRDIDGARDASDHFPLLLELKLGDGS